MHGVIAAYPHGDQQSAFATAYLTVDAMVETGHLGDGGGTALVINM